VGNPFAVGISKGRLRGGKGVYAGMSADSPTPCLSAKQAWGCAQFLYKNLIYYPELRL